MTVCAVAAILALLLCYLKMSEGALSSPLNLSVELLDFKALARWLPGPGNPKGTRYSLEFIDINHFTMSTWNQARGCTNISSTQCDLILDQRILTEYFVRVMAQWKEERSPWARLARSFQPLGYTLLSAPNLTVAADPHSILISLSHPVQSLTEVRMKFSVDLFLFSNNTAEKHIAQKVTTRSSQFVNLSSGNYCINASAFLTAGSKCNSNATTCVFLHQEHIGRKIWVVNVGVLTLMTIPAMVGLIILYFYVRPFNNSYFPTVLHFNEGTRVVQTLSFEELRTHSLSGMVRYDCKVTQEDMDGYSFSGYHERLKGNVMRKGSAEINEYGSLSTILDEADQNMALVSDLYTTSTQLEDAEKSLTQSECHVFGLTSKNSFSDVQPPSAASGQNTEIENFLESEYLYGGSTSWHSSYYSEHEDSFEIETENLPSDFSGFGSSYEPRPDPHWMLNNQFGSQH